MIILSGENSLPAPPKQQQPRTATFALDFDNFISTAFLCSYFFSDLLASCSSHSEPFHKEQLSHGRECRWPRVCLQAWSPTHVASPRLGQQSPDSRPHQAGWTLFADGLGLSNPAGGRSATCGAWDTRACSEHWASIPNSRETSVCSLQPWEGKIVVFKTEWGGEEGAWSSIVKGFKLCYSKSVIGKTL